jgi:diguanylate cyclase (GGDEF)-like protein
MNPVQRPHVTDAQPKRDGRHSALRAVGSAGRVTSEREALMRIAAATVDAYRLEDVMEQAAEAALDVTGAASLSISKWERERGAMRTLINVGELGPREERFPSGELYPLEEHPLVAKLLHDGQPYFTAVDDPEASQPAVEVLTALGKDSDVGVPIFLDGDVWGEVWATTAAGSRRFDAGDVRFLQAIADRLALVLARGERFARVSRLAYEDPLTGLANRRAIDERLAMLLDPDAPRAPLTLLLADVDGLKDINDANGHHVGDAALCRVAEALVAASAPEAAALVGRLAGDEFCVLLEGRELDAAEEVAQATLELLAASGDPPLSLSFGAAAATPGIGPAELLRTADTAQYAAKRRGGGRLCSANPDATGQTGDGSDRRNVRSRGLDQRLERTASRTLAMLDTELAHRRALDRIEAVTIAFSATLNAAAWAISRWERGSPVIRTVSTADDRDSRLRGIRMGLANEVYQIDDFPASVQALTTCSSGYVARAGDEDTDLALRELLGTMGFTTALVGVAPHGSGAFLVEIYGDGETADPTSAAMRMQLLLRLAAAPRSAS